MVDTSAFTKALFDRHAFRAAGVFYTKSLQILNIRERMTFTSSLVLRDKPV